MPAVLSLKSICSARPVAPTRGHVDFDGEAPRTRIFLGSIFADAKTERV